MNKALNIIILLLILSMALSSMVLGGITTIKFYKKNGDCPECFQMDLKDVNRKVGGSLKASNRKSHKIQLFYDNQLITELGRVGGIHRLKNVNQVKLHKNLMDKLAKLKLQPRKSLDGILKLIDDKGEVKEIHKVILVFQLPNKPPDRKRPDPKRESGHFYPSE